MTVELFAQSTTILGGTASVVTSDFTNRSMCCTQRRQSHSRRALRVFTIEPNLSVTGG